MPVNILMSVLCLTGIAFNIRFFAALCEKRNRWTAYWVRLHADSNEEAIPEQWKHKRTADRAA